MFSKAWNNKTNQLNETLISLSKLTEEIAYISDILSLWIINTPETTWKICWGKQLYQWHGIRQQFSKRLSEIYLDDKITHQDDNTIPSVFNTAFKCKKSKSKSILLSNQIYSNFLQRINLQLKHTDLVMDEPTTRILQYAGNEIKKMKNQIAQKYNEITNKKFPASTVIKIITGSDKVLFYLPLQPSRETSLKHNSRKEKEAETLNGFTKKLLHTNLINLEIATMECCASIILEFKNISEELYSDIVRQIWDEARHAEGCYYRMLQLGGKLGDYNTDTILWKMQKDKPLELRFAIHQRIGEWIGVDGAIWHAKKLKESGDFITAGIFDFITADEITHVRFGNKWLLKILKNKESIQKIHRKALAIRKSFGKNTTKFIFPFNEWVCHATGFSKNDVEKMKISFVKQGSIM